MISDAEGVRFLQWCLPKLKLRWPGFRKVRRRVYKRITHRLYELGLSDLDGYRAYLGQHPQEWHQLSASCWICISHFYRDRSVFQYLETDVLPELARRAIQAGQRELRCWSAGCASGEEPYTIAIIWKQSLARQYPPLEIRIVATDIDPEVVQRAQHGCYPWSSVKSLPADWRDRVFIRSGDQYSLKEEYRETTEYLVQDLRENMPEGIFHLILCRNLVFTYFDETSQREILQKLIAKLVGSGALVTAKNESLPQDHFELEPWGARLGIHRRIGQQTSPTDENQTIRNLAKKSSGSSQV